MGDGGGAREHSRSTPAAGPQPPCGASSWIQSLDAGSLTYLLLHPRCLRQDLILLRKEFLQVHTAITGSHFAHSDTQAPSGRHPAPEKLREKASTCFANPHRSWGCWERDEAPVASCKRKRCSFEHVPQGTKLCPPLGSGVRQRGGDRTL